MKIVVAGAGEVGTHLARLLSNGNHDVIVIDTDEEKLKSMDAHFDILTVYGSALSIATLKEAKIKTADLFICVTPYEEMNITAAILGKKLGAKKTIARIDNMEYIQPENKLFFANIGIDSLIYPEMLAAKEISNLLYQSGTNKVFEFAGGKLSLIVIRLEENAPIINKSLIEATRENAGVDYRAVAITRNSETIIPRGSDVFKCNDVVYIITNLAGVENMLKYSGKERFEIKNVMIMGGSRVGKKAAKELSGQFNIKLLEIDRDKSFELADELNNTLILNIDGRDIASLEEEGIRQTDAFVAVTGNSEANILACILAKKLGVKKTIAEVENMDYIDIAANMGIDSIINKKQIAASHIFGFTMNADVFSVKCMTGTDAEILEFIAADNSKITKTQIKDVNFPNDAIVGGVIRGKSTFIATGLSQINANDRVVVFALPSAISKVEKFFS